MLHRWAANRPRNCRCNTGVPPVSPSRPHIVSSPSTVGVTEPPPLGLATSQTCHRAVAAAGIPRLTLGYGFRRRPQSLVATRPAHGRRPLRPLAGAQPRLPQTATPPETAPIPPAQSAPILPRPALRSTSSPQTPSSLTLSLPEPVVESDDDPHFLGFVEHYIPKHWAREQRTEPVCCATIRLLSLDSPSPPPIDLLKFIPSPRRSQVSDVLALTIKIIL